MSARFTVLASGSSGNASLLEIGGFGLLIDCGLNPRELSNRLLAAGRSWQAVHAVLLTHTHGDHWNALTLAHLRGLNISLIAHARHHDTLASRKVYDPLRRAGLTVSYEDDRTFEITPSLTCRPVRVPHDSDPTFAFRFEATGSPDPAWALGFASDVGRPTPELIEAFAGVDVLALEFNHDVALQRNSNRPRILVNRVLGDNGHLSNAQAADVTRSVAGCCRHGLQAVVQLHLSRDCNRPELAAQAGRAALALDAPKAVLVTASQDRVAASVTLHDRRARPVRSPRPAVLPFRSVQLSLPGLESEPIRYFE